MTRKIKNDSRPSCKLRLNPQRARPTMRPGTPLVAFDPSQLMMTYIMVESRDGGQAGAPTTEIGDIKNEVAQLRKLGIGRIKVFVRSERRDKNGSEASNSDSFLIQAIKAWKDEAPEIGLTTETCFCPVSRDGRCGSFTEGDHAISAVTDQRLLDLALAQVQAGADQLGIANVIEGSTRLLRNALDREGWQDVSLAPHLIIRSDAAYGDFRVATGVPVDVDRAATQIHPNDADQVLNQLAGYECEGADEVLLEPGFLVLDHISRVKQKAKCPIGSFSISGEYRMISRWDDHGAQLFAELCASILRTGANYIATYAAKDLLRRHAR